MSFKKCKDLILGVVMLLFSGFYLYNASQITTRPRMVPSYANSRIVPYILGVLLAVMAILLIIQGVKKLKAPDTQEASGEKTDVLTVALTFAVIIGYVSLMQPAGFILSTIIFLFLQMIVMAPKEKRNLVLFGVIAVVFTVFVFAAFYYGLKMSLPRGVIERLLNL